MWMKTTQQDLESMNLSLNEATDMAQNHPLRRMMSTFGIWHYALIVVHARNQWMTKTTKTTATNRAENPPPSLVQQAVLRQVEGEVLEDEGRLHNLVFVLCPTTCDRQETPETTCRDSRLRHWWSELLPASDQLSYNTIQYNKIHLYAHWLSVKSNLRYGWCGVTQQRNHSYQ